MLIAKQMDIRANIKKYFDLAYNGETILVPRKESKNIVIMSEDEYNRITRAERLGSYAEKITAAKSSAIAEGISSIRNDNLSKLENIRNLKDNWNGNGAPALPINLIEKTRKLLEDLPIQPEIFPTALSTIQLEYDNSRRDHMEIDIGQSDMAEIFIVTYFGKEITENIQATSDAISRRVIQFYG
ncbi:MAG: type II toxin-antitoxin system Phd/YefM family antitoxin [Butyrivibrio sp.]|nr:type II toxin-antitoxin system Phd/YefM family antitoxin [Butyrivibrio sp.]